MIYDKMHLLGGVPTNHYKKNRARIWVAAIIYKGSQLIRLNNVKLKFPDTVDEGLKLQENAKKRNEIRAVEEHFFLTSIIKAIQWLKQVEFSNDDIKKAIDYAINSFETARLTRDVREHENEYLEELYYTERSKY